MAVTAEPAEPSYFVCQVGVLGGKLEAQDALSTNIQDDVLQRIAVKVARGRRGGMRGAMPSCRRGGTSKKFGGSLPDQSSGLAGIVENRFEGTSPSLHDSVPTSATG